MLDEYRREYIDFNSALMREYYSFLSGQKLNLDIATIYDRYSDLFAADVIAGLKQNLNDMPDHFESERKSVERLLLFATDQYLENSVKNLTESINEYESRATIKARNDGSGGDITFQDSDVALRTEPDREARHSIYKNRVAVIKASNDLRAERVAGLHKTARSLGYDSYTALYEQLRGLDYQEIGRKAEPLLSRTEAIYVARLDEALKRDLGIRIGEADRSDLFYFLHLTGYDERFPCEELLRIYRDTMAGLGIDVKTQKNILIDSEPRPHKRPRAFCMPITVPDEVMLVIRPVGGQSDYQALFHEAGHAQHYGWTSASLNPEFKYTGDYALTETFAFLFHHLIVDGLWLEEFIGFSDSRDFIQSLMLARLVSVRRYITKLLYEREMHLGEDFARAAYVYAELQTSATGFTIDEHEFLFDLDDAFYSANYVRAWAFELEMREYLKTRFGHRWWASRRAGNFLKEVWETGDRYTADELAAQIGIGPIKYDSLIDEFNQALK